MRRGDTIIEVMIAVSVFAMLAVGVTMLMNSSIATGQRSLELTLVRQQIDAQAELLRFARDNQLEAWTQVTGEFISDQAGPSTFDACPGTAADLAGRPFMLNLTTTGDDTVVEVVRLSEPDRFVPASVHSEVSFDDRQARGIWVTAVPSQGSVGSYDMYIRACWDSVGTSHPMHISTIVRLYDT